LSWCQARLKRLVDLELSQRVFPPRASRAGSSPAMYTLATRGIRYLRSQNLDVPDRYRPSEEAQRSYLFMSHTRAINDVLISLELLCRQTPGLALRRLLHEHHLKRDPAYVQDGARRRIAVIPDAYTSLVLNDVEELNFSYELDRGTESARRWRTKVRHLVAWSQGPYIDKFQTTALTIAVLATPGEKRMRDLLQWTEAELEALGQTAEADLFRFAGGSPDAVSPKELFAEPCWLRPFDREPMPLLDLAPQSTIRPPAPAIAIVGA